MIRKQLYIAPEQDRKVKTLAHWRGCTEAEIVREALDRLPDPDGDVVAQLEAAGLIIPRQHDPNALTPEELEQLDAEFYAWLDGHPETIGLLDALQQDRERYRY